MVKIKKNIWTKIYVYAASEPFGEKGYSEIQCLAPPVVANGKLPIAGTAENKLTGGFLPPAAHVIGISVLSAEPTNQTARARSRRTRKLPPAIKILLPNKTSIQEKEAMGPFLFFIH